MKSRLIILAGIGGLMVAACSKSFLNAEPQGVVTEEVLANKNGVMKLLVAAYHDVTGLTIKSGWWSTTGVNWVYGDITSGDTYRGGYNDGNDGVLIEQFRATPSTGYFQEKWNADYDGVSRSNAVIRATNKATDMTAAEKTRTIAEARFLRGHFHFDAKKLWNKIPYIDETVTDFKVYNEPDIWPQIIADFKFAFDNLPEVQPLKGQANKWAAACYMAKCYMFRQQYDSAKLLLDNIISNGKNSQGKKYALTPCFYDNFNAATEHNEEQVFQIEFSVNDGSDGGNSNIGESGNTPAFYPISSFYTTWKQPSFNLVNSFKTDADGLPMLDTFNNTNMKSDMGEDPYDCTYVPYQETVDPRLDWSVGRRGVPYLDWGPHQGGAWINDQTFGGPYSPVKNNYRQDQVGVLSDNYAQGYLLGSAVNYSIIRFADVLLWAAECETEIGSLEKAREYVNKVRARARDGCSVAIDYSNDCYSGLYPSANYFIDTYNVAWAGKDEARKKVRFERRLELALEGHRFFDLVRWGIAGEYMNAYFNVEKTRLSHLAGLSFTKGKHEYFPIPQQEIDLSNKDGKPLLKQNPGY
jgi:hypothetical protein